MRDLASATKLGFIRDALARPGRQHLRAFVLTAPALVAALLLPEAPPYEAMLFRGGWDVFAMNASLAVLFPYFVLFLIACGTLFMPEAREENAGQLYAGDVMVIRFFAGAGLVTVAGFVMGAAVLLRPPVTIAVFCSVLYAYFLTRQPMPRLAATTRLAARILGAAIVSVLALLLLVRGLVVNLYTSDVIQLYFPYLAEVRLQRGIWLDPAHPVFSDFLIGRGNGVHLFFASFAGQFVIQLLSLLYLLGMALVVHRLVRRMLPPAAAAASHGAGVVLPLAGMLLALCTPVLYVEFAKYHMQTGAFLLFLTWAGLLFLFVEGSSAKWLFRMLVPVAIALPISLPQYQAIATCVIGVCLLAVLAMGNWPASRHLLWLVAAGLVAMLASLCFNQLYIGVGELNPPSLFLPMIDLERFSKWSSIELVQYLGFAQDVKLTVPPLSFETLKVLAKDIGQLFIPLNTRTTGASMTLWAGMAVFVAALVVAARPSLHSLRQAYAAYLDRRLGLFLGSLLAIYVAGWVMTQMLNQGSAARVMEYQRVYRAFVPLIIPCILIAGVSWHASQAAGRLRTAAMHAAVTLVAFAAVALSAMNLYAIDGGSQMRGSWKGGAVPAPVKGAVRYFVGRANLIEANGKLEHWGVDGQWDFHRCTVLSALVPPGASILPLNAVFAIVPCQNSPLVPRNRFIHHYESVLAPHFGELLFAPAEVAYAIYRRHKVDYFYVARGDIYFWGPGYADSFNPDPLVRHFDVHYEDDKFILLTWRGGGRTPVPVQVATEIEALRHRARTEPGISEYWRGVVRLKHAMANNAKQEK